MARRQFISNGAGHRRHTGLGEISIDGVRERELQKDALVTERELPSSVQFFAPLKHEPGSLFDQNDAID